MLTNEEKGIEISGKWENKGTNLDSLFENKVEHSQSVS